MVNKNLSVYAITDKKQADENIKKPEFEGGVENFYKIFRRKLDIPNSVKNTKNVISISMKFTINEDGSISNFNNYAIGYLAPVSEVFIKEVDKALKKMPNWIPAEKDGKKIKYNQVLSWKITIR